MERGCASCGQAAKCQAQSHLWDVFRKQNITHYTAVVLSDLSPFTLLHYLKLVQYVRSTQEALVRHFNIWIIQISTSCSDSVKILTYMRQIIHEHSHVHCVSPRLLEVTHSPRCPGFNRSTLVAAGRYYAHHSSQSLNSHSINIHKPHISQAKLKNPLGVVFFLETNHQALAEVAKHCPLLSGNQKPFVAQWVMTLVMLFNHLSLLSTVFFSNSFLPQKNPNNKQTHKSLLTSNRSDLALLQYLLQPDDN